MSTADLSSGLDGLTVPQLLRRQARARPEARALSAPSHCGPRARLSYAELVVAMERAARHLQAQGVRPGDRVAMLLSNDAIFEAVLTALGCYRLGAIVAPLNERAGDTELSHALDLVAPRAVVMTTDGVTRFGPLVGDSRALVLPDTRESVGFRPNAPCDGVSVAIEEPHDPEQATALLLTSGTTGPSKAVVHCHRSQVHLGASIATALGLRPDDVYHGPFPIYTSSVLNLACMASWSAGAALVLEPKSVGNVERLQLIVAEKTTFFHGVPAVLRFLADAAQSVDVDLSRVRRLAYGGAAMPLDWIRRFAEQWPAMEQLHVWGQTETGAGTCLPPSFLPAKAGCLGAPMRGCEIRVVADDGQSLPIDAAGEILFRGRSAAVGYWRSPTETAATFVDGWVRTGDVGRIDADGHLHFVDRRKDIVNRGGLKIGTAWIEGVLLRHIDVLEAAVVPTPHETLGEDILACVVLRPGATCTADDLQRHSAHHLASNQVPRQWRFLAELPRNAMGKVQKRLLRER